MTSIHLVHVDSLACEAILREAPNGELVIVSQIGGTKEPEILNRVYAFHSKDQGRTWTKTISVFPEDGRAVYCTELTRLNDKLIAFLTIHNGKFLEYENVVMMSEDSGYTWYQFFGFPQLNGFHF